MRRLLLLIAGILILTAVAVPSAAVYYFAFTEAGLQYLFSKIPAQGRRRRARVHRRPRHDRPRPAHRPG